MRLAGPVYRQDGMPRSMYRPLIFVRWHIDEDSKGLLIRHRRTGTTFRMVEPGYPSAVQELRPGGARTRLADALEVARIGQAARDVVSMKYWSKTYRRARHGGAVYYQIFRDYSRVMEDAPRIIAAGASPGAAIMNGRPRSGRERSALDSVRRRSVLSPGACRPATRTGSAGGTPPRDTLQVAGGAIRQGAAR
jgi:hypothetical protein